MIDIVYVVATLVFFAVMMLYVAGCARLGRSSDADRVSDERQ